MKNKKIYILHGWTYSVEKWEPFVKELQQNGFDVKLLKIPGLTTTIDRPWNLDDYVEWLGSVVPSNEKVILLGHSNGGRIAAKFSVQYPEKVGHLILIDSSGIYDTRLHKQIKRAVFGTAAKVGKGLLSFNLARKILYKAAREHDYETADPFMRMTMRNLIREDLAEDFKKITVPTLIIWGKMDRSTPLSQGREIHLYIPHSKLFIIDTARHSPMFTNAKEIMEIILKEISSQ